ncbi:MAG: nitronate monooxygenase family protein [Myxococcota bacterium]|jgi:NAD(P)H-dependent flavin oxidoreductase YrpB (nitropropane dioxygenase family)|nr:nitronate monooxygenase family protein [Myxococcota bacterium]
MRTPLCEKLGIEFPIFAFTHCRDVVAAVSAAGGLGVLGAVGFSAEQLEIEMKWIDDHVGDKPYGVDIVIPGKYEGKGTDLDAGGLERKLNELVPQGHRDFAAKLLRDAGVPELPAGEKARELLGWTATTAGPQIEAILKHPKVKVVANALGTPPPEVIREIQASGRLVGALCGSVKHALAHKEAGVDFVIAQGGEGGGHTGDIGSIVLWPQVVDAVAPLPMLAAGGIGDGRQMAAALMMGAQGVWTGSLWLTVAEAEATPPQKEALLHATSHDTVRSRSFTGKPCRMLRNEWTEAWEKPENPKPLGMPLQWMVTADAVSRGHRYANKAKAVAFNPVGQVVGMMNEEKPVREVIVELVEQYLEAVERFESIQPKV